MKKISWRKAKGGRYAENLLEGYVNNELAFMIEGTLCVTDLRETRNPDTEWVLPKHYSIKDRDEAKQIASDLLNGINLEIHEANYQKGVAESQKTIDLLEDVRKLLDSLKS